MGHTQRRNLRGQLQSFPVFNHNVRTDILQNAVLGHTPHSHQKECKQSCHKVYLGFLVGATDRPKDSASRTSPSWSLGDCQLGGKQGSIVETESSNRVGDDLVN